MTPFGWNRKKTRAFSFICTSRMFLDRCVRNWYQQLLQGAGDTGGIRASHCNYYCAFSISTMGMYYVFRKFNYIFRVTQGFAETQKLNKEKHSWTQSWIFYGFCRPTTATGRTEIARISPHQYILRLGRVDQIRLKPKTMMGAYSKSFCTVHSKLC